jgi:hypothetical protein
MKKLTFLTIFLISAGLFTGCKKDNDKTTVNPAYSSTIDYDYNTFMTYRLAVHRPAADPLTGGNPIMNWNNGTMHVSAVIFNAMLPQGNEVRSEKFGTQVDKTLTLFDADLIATVKIPTLKTAMTSFTIEATAAGSQHTLVLNGVYYNTHDISPLPPIPVQVIVDEPITINSQWVNNFETGGAGHAALMQLDMGQLVVGIDRSMMNNATMTGSTIIISSTSNGKIYNILFNNLKQMTVPVKCLTNTMSTASGAIM